MNFEISVQIFLNDEEDQNLIGICYPSAQSYKANFSKEIWRLSVKML